MYVDILKGLFLADQSNVKELWSDPVHDWIKNTIAGDDIDNYVNQVLLPTMANNPQNVHKLNDEIITKAKLFTRDWLNENLICENQTDDIYYLWQKTVKAFDAYSVCFPVAKENYNRMDNKVCCLGLINNMLTSVEEKYRPEIPLIEAVRFKLSRHWQKYANYSLTGRSLIDELTRVAKQWDQFDEYSAEIKLILDSYNW